MNKKYWLKGLITGIIIYALCVLGAYFFIVYSAPKGNYFGEALALIVGFVIYYLSPAIPLGLLIGWMYGKVPKIAVFLSIIVFVSMVCIEVLIIKNNKGMSPIKLPYNVIGEEIYKLIYDKVKGLKTKNIFIQQKNKKISKKEYIKNKIKELCLIENNFDDIYVFLEKYKISELEKIYEIMKIKPIQKIQGQISKCKELISRIYLFDLIRK